MMKGCSKHCQQVRVAALHLVVDGGRADDAAGPAGLRLLQAQQADDVAGIRVIGLQVGGLVDAGNRVARILAHVAHMAEQMALGVLRHRVAEMTANAPIGQGTFRRGPTVDRQAAKHDEAPPVNHVVLNSGEYRAKTSQRKIRLGHIFKINVPGGVDSRVNLGDVVVREGVEPIVAGGHVRAEPGRRIGCFHIHVSPPLVVGYRSIRKFFWGGRAPHGWRFVDYRRRPGNWRGGGAHRRCAGFRGGRQLPGAARRR